MSARRCFSASSLDIPRPMCLMIRLTSSGGRLCPVLLWQAIGSRKCNVRRLQLRSWEITSAVDTTGDLRRPVYWNPWYWMVGSLPRTRKKQSCKEVSYKAAAVVTRSNVSRFCVSQDNLWTGQPLQHYYSPLLLCATEIVCVRRG